MNTPPPTNALMRHADYSGNTEEDTILNPDSLDFLQDHTIPKLIEHIGKVEINIIYSPLMRAVLTANVLRSVLVRQGYTVHTHEEPLLRERSQIEISGHAYDNIRSMYTIQKDTFTLFITHNPIIERSLGREIDYCCVVAHDFEIPGHK